MPGRLEGKTAFVTGSSKGIGAGIAVELAREGADVAINYRSSAEEAEAVAARVRDLGRTAVTLRGDVGDQATIERLVAEAAEQLGGLDLFVSNAVYSAREPFLDADLDEFKKTIDVSMWGAFYGVRAACRLMREQFNSNGRGGSVLVVSSPHADIAFPTAMAYNMAKAALDQMARTAAVEMAKYDVRVNILHPGWIDTPGERKFFTEEQIAEGAKSLLLKRLGTPEECGKAAAYVLSDDAAYMTGSTLSLDGGVKLPYWSRREEGGQ
ncbi:SDR family NAD(P)-dependent oxidoreductase [Alienimonas californiensis]|uniref:Glucose 1-dehydrogenase 2 n=1 Tax=Alienimonas californiensis TaxID=2527989 RepID=A0A517P7Q5_9PLAN|nr:SDR family oxidoreductase [Alienimonas californiensis]QDT15414.1 Glucose 1-dehydrogenase 2 [Alienimonas californiensis]